MIEGGLLLCFFLSQGLPIWRTETVAGGRSEGGVGQIHGTVANGEGARQTNRKHERREAEDSETSRAHAEGHVEPHWNKGQRDKREAARTAEQQ